MTHDAVYRCPHCEYLTDMDIYLNSGKAVHFLSCPEGWIENQTKSRERSEKAVDEAYERNR